MHNVCLSVDETQKKSGAARSLAGNCARKLMLLIWNAMYWEARNRPVGEGSLGEPCIQVLQLPKLGLHLKYFARVLLASPLWLAEHLMRRRRGWHHTALSQLATEREL